MDVNRNILLEIVRYGAQKKQNLMLISNINLFFWKNAAKKVIIEKHEKYGQPFFHSKKCLFLQIIIFIIRFELN